MRAPRDILKHVSVEAAKAKRKCYRNNKHSIIKGELCVVVQESNFGGSKNYCIICSEDILNAAANKVRSLHIELLKRD
ncbi:MAG TPA: hypothetical protein VJ875_16645 [Pyrinomonadaceae bacterium]|nr:hypothetical protein [Pyrinomonadaceae bacterium]